MPEFNEGIAHAPEMVQPISGVEQMLVADAVPNQHDAYIAVSSILEMPISHPEFDSEGLTVGGLIKACPYYGKLAETNPELARTEAAEVVQRVQERETMREKGMSDGDIKKQQWSSMLERHREKAKAENKAVPENARQERKVEPARRSTAEQQITAVEDLEPIAYVAQREAAELKPSPLVQAVPRKAANVEMATASVVRENEAVPVMTVERVAPRVNRTTIEAAQVHEAAEAAPFLPVEAFSETVAHHAAAYQEALERSPTEPTEEATATFETEISPLAEGLYKADETAFTQEEAGGLLSVYGLEKPVVALVRTTLPQRAAGLSTRTHEITPQHESVAEPVKVFESFTGALHNTIAGTATPKTEEFTTESGEVIPSTQHAEQQDTPPKPEPVPAIAHIVAEHLSALDTTEEKEKVAPVLQEIAVEAETIKFMAETAYIEPEIIEMETARLEELVTELFEHLHIEYDHEDIKQFLTVLLRHDFQPQQQGAADATLWPDLENTGTHEVKRHHTQLAGMLADIEWGIERTIGNLALFFASTSRLRNLAAPAL